MAVTKTVLNTALVIEVSVGVNEAGNKMWRKRTFQGVKQEAENQNIFDVAKAIEAVLGLEARDFHLVQNIALTSN